VIGQFEFMKILSVNPVFCEDKSRVTELGIFGSTQQCFDNYTGGPAALAADPNKVFTEEDWTDPDKLDAYGKSKTLAEKAAWDYVA
jgi:nucleoside-diphosphate-sugar epimerase